MYRLTIVNVMAFPCNKVICILGSLFMLWAHLAVADCTQWVYVAHWDRVSNVMDVLGIRCMLACGYYGATQVCQHICMVATAAAGVFRYMYPVHHPLTSLTSILIGYWNTGELSITWSSAACVRMRTAERDYQTRIVMVTARCLVGWSQIWRAQRQRTEPVRPWFQKLDGWATVHWPCFDLFRIIGNRVTFMFEPVLMSSSLKVCLDC